MKNKPAPLVGKHQILFRVPLPLYRKLLALSNANDLSVNAQLVELVEDAVEEKVEAPA